MDVLSQLLPDPLQVRGQNDLTNKPDDTRVRARTMVGSLSGTKKGSYLAGVHRCGGEGRLCEGHGWAQKVAHPTVVLLVLLAVLHPQLLPG